MKNEILMAATAVIALALFSSPSNAQAVYLNVSSSAAAPGEEGNITIILDSDLSLGGGPGMASELSFTVVYPQDVVTAYVAEGWASSYWDNDFQCAPQAGSYRCVISGTPHFSLSNISGYPNVVAIVVLHPFATATATSAQVQITEASVTLPNGTSLPVSANAGYLAIAQPSNALRLSLSDTSGQPGANASMSLYLDTRFAQEPAGMQWTFVYDPASVNAVHVSEGPEAIAAEKTVACAAQAQPGEYKCLLYGINYNNLSTGFIATATFALSAGASGVIPVRLNGSMAVSLNAEVVPLLAYGANITVEGAGDTTAPVRSGGSPSGVLQTGTNSTLLSVLTDEAATCRYSQTAGVAYASMAGAFSSTGGIAHNATAAGLQNGQSYAYHVRCIDQLGNANADDYSISFSVASGNVTVSRRLLLNAEGPVNKPLNGAVIFINAVTKSVAGTLDFVTDASGQALVILPAGLPAAVDMKISVMGFLSGMVRNPDVASAATLNITAPQLLAGDVDGDGVINSFDFSLMTLKWQQNYQTADFNRDNTVDSQDFSFMKKNWWRKEE